MHRHLTRRFVVAGAAVSGFAPGLSRANDTRIEAPVRYLFNRVWTGVWINGQGPLRFALGSGANLSAIAKTRADGLKMRLTSIPVRSGASGRPVDIYQATTMNVGGVLELTRVDMGLMRGQDDEDNDRLFDGVLPLMPDRRTALSVDSDKMILGGREPLGDRYRPIPTLRRYEQIGWRPRIEAKIGGQTVRLLVNTGSPYGLTLFPQGARRLGAADWPGAAYERRGRQIVDLEGPPDHAVGPLGSPPVGVGTNMIGRRRSAFTRPNSTAPYDRTLDGPILTRVMRAPPLQIGDLRFVGSVAGVQISDTARHDDLDGMIGMELLRRLDLVFDPDDSCLWIRPNGRFDDPWRHDRAGFTLAQVGSTWRVTLVDPGSPAERAGLRPGDVAPGLDRIGAANLAWQAGSPEAKLVRFEVVREGKVTPISITPADRV